MAIVNPGTGAFYTSAERTAQRNASLPAWARTGGYSPVTSSYATGAGLTTGGYTGSVPMDATRANIAAQQAVNQARIPGAAGMEEQSSKMIEDQLLGKVPGDVEAMLGQSAAERGIATGMPGSGNMNAAYLRALGLTSIGQQQQGQQNLSAAYARNPAAPIMNAESMVITPLQQAQLDLSRYQAETGRIGATRTGGGGGGGGYSPRTASPETGEGGYIPASTLFGSGRSGYVFSNPTESTPVTYSGTPASNFSYGYQPTSSGSMYMGNAEGYDSEFDNYTNGGWMDDFFGNYGG